MNPASNRYSLLIGIWIAAILGATFLYFQLNAPLQRIAINLKPVVLSLFFLLSFTGYGFPIARRILKDNAMQILSSAAFGIGLTSLFVYFLGWAGMLEAIWFLIWTLLGFVLFVVYLFRTKIRFRFPVWNLWNAIAVAVIGLFLIQALPSTVAPEITTDGLEFHLLVPKIYLATKRIDYIPHFVESNYPSLGEYIYTLILRLSNDTTCKSFHFWIGILLLFAIGKLSREASPRTSASLAPALFISMPVSALVLAWPWNDLLFTFYVVLCLLFLLSYHKAEGNVSDVTPLILAGTMGGFASCTKYTFVMVSLALFLLFLIGMIRWNYKWKHLILFALPILTLSSIWMIKNLLLTGNPFYPFLNSIFHSPTWNSASNTYFLGTLSKYELPEWNWKMFFIFPYYMTIQPRIIDVHVGILPLLLAPLILMRSESRSITFLKGFVFFYILSWLFIRTEIRSLFSMFAVLWCIYATALQRLTWPNRKLQSWFVAVLALVFVSNFFTTIFTSHYLFDPVKHFFGKESREEYRSRLAEHQHAYDFLNQRSDVHKVLLIGMHNPYYLRYEPVFSSCCDPPIAEWLASAVHTGPELAAHIRESGITHVVFNAKNYAADHHNGLYSWSVEKRRLFEEFLKSECSIIARAGDDIVLQVRQ